MSASDDTTDGDEPNGLDATTVEPKDEEEAGEESDAATTVGRTAGKAGGTVVSGVKGGVRRLWDGIVYGVSNAVGTDKVYQKRFKKLIKRMYKVGGADAVAFVATKKGEIVPTPVKYRPPHADLDLEEEDESPHGYWEAAHFDQTFSAATHEISTEHIYNVPVVWLHTDHWAEMSFSGALLAEAVDMGQKDVLYKNPKFNVIELMYAPDATAGASSDASGGDAPAVTDGGGALQARTKLEHVSPGSLDDAVIDVASPGSLDGTRVQWEKYTHLEQDQSTVEEMNQVEQRGWLAGKLEAENDDNSKNLKWWILGIVGGMLCAFFLGAKFGGGGSAGGGGGGGGMMPLVMSMGMLARTAPVEVGWR